MWLHTTWLVNSHENDKQYDALESEVLAEGVDEQVHQQQPDLHEQRRPVPGQRQLHVRLVLVFPPTGNLEKPVFTTLCQNFGSVLIFFSP